MKVKLSVGFGSCFLLPFIPSALSDERENVVASPNWEMIVFFEEEQRRRRANKGQKAPVWGQTANWPRTVWSIYCLGKEQGTIWRGLTSGEKTLLWAGPTFVLENSTSWTTTRWTRTWMRRRSWMRWSIRRESGQPLHFPKKQNLIFQIQDRWWNCNLCFFKRNYL